jgi:hypothetical protein
MSWSEFNAYLDMFKKNKAVINEADELEGVDIDETDDTEEAPKKDKQVPPVEKKDKANKATGEADLKFSIDLATEFSNTVNQFTNVCAKMVETRMVNKTIADKFYDLHAKIKNLAEAASKTE